MLLARCSSGAAPSSLAFSLLSSLVALSFTKVQVLMALATIIVTAAQQAFILVLGPLPFWLLAA